MKDKPCCFTGHREIPEKERTTVKAKTKQEIIALIENGVAFFGTGGARGFDTLAAEIILELKEIYPHIKLILIIPCANQTKGWAKDDTAKYNHIKSRADKIRILSQSYYSGCMHTRNRHMVDHSAYCICYCRKTSGGTAYTVDYAIKSNIQVICV